MPSLVAFLPLFLLCTSLPGLATPPLDKPEDPQVVYRADMLSPANLRLQGKFLPRGLDLSRPEQPPPDLSLYKHVFGSKTGTSRHDSAYVSTTKSLEFARQFLHTILGSRGFIYKIHTSPNFIDVESSLREFSMHPLEREVAALGGIHYEQVLSWIEFEEGIEQPEVLNPNYASRFDKASWGGAQVQLAGFPKNHAAWSRHPWKTFTSCRPSIKKMKRELCEPHMSATEFGLEYVADIFVHEVEMMNMEPAGNQVSTKTRTRGKRRRKGKKRTGAAKQRGKIKAKAKTRKSNKSNKVGKVKVAKLQTATDTKVSEGRTAASSKPSWWQEAVQTIAAAAAAIVPSKVLVASIQAGQMVESAGERLASFGIKELCKCATALGMVPEQLAMLDVYQVSELLSDIKDVATEEFIDGLECAEQEVLVMAA